MKNKEDQPEADPNVEKGECETDDNVMNDQADADTIDSVMSDAPEEKEDSSKGSGKNDVCGHYVCQFQPYTGVFQSITKNSTSWCLFMLSIWIVSKKKFGRGVVTLFVMLFLVYWVHNESHNVRNWFTISHHYHHENNNWLSHVIQIMMEMQFGLLLPIINSVVLGNVLDKWVIILLYVFYTSVHNINYSVLHVNQTHELHHKDTATNVGPDICDLLFQSKNQTNAGEEGYLEDTSHYVPNIILGTICVVILKKLYKNKLNRMLMNTWSYIVLAFISVFIAMTNTYLLYNDRSPQTENAME